MSPPPCAASSSWIGRTEHSSDTTQPPVGLGRARRILKKLNVCWPALLGGRDHESDRKFGGGRTLAPLGEKHQRRCRLDDPLQGRVRERRGQRRHHLHHLDGPDQRAPYQASGVQAVGGTDIFFDNLAAPLLYVAKTSHAVSKGLLRTNVAIEDSMDMRCRALSSAGLQARCRYFPRSERRASTGSTMQCHKCCSVATFNR